MMMIIRLIIIHFIQEDPFGGVVVVVLNAGLEAREARDPSPGASFFTVASVVDVLSLVS